MNRTDLLFDKPEGLNATAPAEARGERRDGVRLMVSSPTGHAHTTFHRIADHLRPGDLLVVNDSATLPASLKVTGPPGRFTLNVATRYGPTTWLAEPRWSYADPGPLPVAVGDRFEACTGDVLVLAPYPGTDRLWFVEGDLAGAMSRCGEPIRYAYVDRPQPLSSYQTVFATAPGSAEMPSAARPFTRSIVDDLTSTGVGIAPVRLHTGVSSLEVETERVEDHPIPPEPYWVPHETAEAITRARRHGGRVIAVGTTVVRALESTVTDGEVRATSGYTRLVITPAREITSVDGMLTGLHDTGASHLAMLYAVAGEGFVRDAYRELVDEGYLWHEFGDSHLLLPTG